MKHTKHTKHTSGPWVTNADEPSLVFAGDVLVSQPSGPDDHTPQSVANARLIAAAPELLESLDGLLHLLNDICPEERLDGDDQALIDRTRAAIRKATGGGK